jgi:hypothetical protein
MDDVNYNIFKNFNYWVMHPVVRVTEVSMYVDWSLIFVIERNNNDVHTKNQYSLAPETP